jgi:hypothetical protein
MGARMKRLRSVGGRAWRSLARSNRSPRTRRSRFRPALEALEPRTLLAADFADLATEPHLLFAPGTPDAYMAQFEHVGDAPSDFAEYEAAKRWSDTSTAGDGSNWGDAAILTWSIARDGATIPGYAGEATSGSNFIATLKSIYGSVSGSLERQPWFQIVSSVFERWSEVSGITFVYEPRDDGAAFSNIASSAPGAAGVRGDIRIGGHAIDGDSGTLAYNFFPDNGEMVLDTSDSFFRDTSNNSLRLRNVMAHEAGHGIGLAHVDPTSQTKLMEPLASTAFDGPQHDDILAAHRLYGDKYEAGSGNNSFSTATKLGDLTGRNVVIGDNSKGRYFSIDGSSDVDYLRFTVAAGTTLDAALTPLGHTYQVGATDGSTSSFNSKAQNNLSLEIYNSQFTLIARANNRGLGGAETLSDVKLLGGDYYFRIRGDRDAAQLYQLNVTAEGATPTGAIDFRDYTIDAYGGSQDHSGTVSLGGGGASLHLTGNRWKKIDFPYTVTSNTVLEFDFTSSSEGQIHGIGFDSNTSISSSLTFQLAGTQSWGIGDFATAKTGATTHYVIPVGQFYTGKATVLFFANDDDIANPLAESIFSNVRVYESDNAASLMQAPKAVDNRYAVDEDSPTVSMNVLKNDDAGSGTMTISGVTISGVSAGSAGGTITIAADQTLHYRPAANFNGTETFTYTIRSAGGSSTARVSVDVRPVNDPPSARGETFRVTAGKSYSLNIMGNDSIEPDVGETLTIIGVGPGSAGGKLSTDGQRIKYTPAAGFTGSEAFRYTINDGTPGSNATATVTVKVAAATSITSTNSTTSSASVTAINFNNHRIDSYGGAQDHSGMAVAGNGGTSLRLTGNTWKKIDVAYTITADTVLELDFSSTSQGELHGIGLDNNTTAAAARTFQLYGTQRWGIGAFDTYASSSGTRRYVIPIGRYYTGPAANLFFINDHDVSNPTAVSMFSNVRLYEAAASQTSRIAAVDKFFAEFGA